jgi:membrane protein YdbS with pleckstrin-like domain
VDSFRPADGFLRYLKFKFWLVLLIVDLAIFAGWLVLFFTLPAVGLATLPIAVAVAVLPDVVAYVAIHLRIDTTWYVMTSRSLRIRRGIWVIHEATITFENIQNIRINQGPLQRHFGIADVLVETAGGGGSKTKEGVETNAGHRGLIEGVADAKGIRDKILRIVMLSRTSGIDDEHLELLTPNSVWAPAHLAVLREIRDTLRTF